MNSAQAFSARQQGRNAAYAFVCIAPWNGILRAMLFLLLRI